MLTSPAIPSRVGKRIFYPSDQSRLPFFCESEDWVKSSGGFHEGMFEFLNSSGWKDAESACDDDVIPIPRIIGSERAMHRIRH